MINFLTRSKKVCANPNCKKKHSQNSLYCSKKCYLERKSFHGKESKEDLKNRKKENLRWYTSSCGKIELQMTIKQAQNVSHSGRCDEDVQFLSEQKEIKEITDNLNKEDLREVVSEIFVDATEEELSNHERNIKKLLWIAGNDIAEEEKVK